jgi:hypothetical protein
MTAFTQYKNPNPNIPCTAGWCLQYVRQAFGLPAKYGTAIEAWNASRFKHRDYNFPANVWVPLWFTVKGVPAGHVVLRAPDGRIYSTTALGRTTATIHPNQAHLERVYAGAGLPLTYQGWTEDVADFLVVKPVPAPAKPAPAPAGKLLTVTVPVAMVRVAPAAYSAVAPGYPDGIAKGAKIAAVGYVKGADPYPNDRSTDDAWIKTKSGYYIWANNVGNSLAGLKKLN